MAFKHSELKMPIVQNTRLSIYMVPLFLGESGTFNLSGKSIIASQYDYNSMARRARKRLYCLSYK